MADCLFDPATIHVFAEWPDGPGGVCGVKGDCKTTTVEAEATCGGCLVTLRYARAKEARRAEQRAASRRRAAEKRKAKRLVAKRAHLSVLDGGSTEGGA